MFRKPVLWTALGSGFAVAAAGVGALRNWDIMIMDLYSMLWLFTGLLTVAILCLAGAALTCAPPEGGVE